MKHLRQIITLGALLLALMHVIWPALAIDAVTVFLIAISILPWLADLVKSLEFPGGWKVEFPEVSRKIIEGKVDSSEKLELAKYQIFSSNTRDGGDYKLYSNGTLVQKLSYKILAHSKTTQVTYPVSFPNEPVSIQVMGELNYSILEMNEGNCVLSYAPSDIDRDVTFIISGI